jgi:type IV secretory pathway VirB3-like protein
MKDKVLIFICFTTAVLFFMCKPMYLILLLTVCSFEYLFFISFVTFYLKAGKAEFYRRFSVSPLKNTQVSTYEI